MKGRKVGRRESNSYLCSVFHFKLNNYDTLKKIILQKMPTHILRLALC
jgi:hypothetical protein